MSQSLQTRTSENARRRQGRFALCVVLVGMVGLAGRAEADAPPGAGEVVPRQIPYRGYLEQNGVAVDSGSTGTAMKFELYEAAEGGTALWQETRTVEVRLGKFGVDLGDVTPIPAKALRLKSLYLSISVDGQLLGKRQRVLTTAYAHRSGDGVPVGTIIDWWWPTPPTALDLPPGFKVCDGTKVDDLQSPFFGLNVPDLRGRFVKGASALSAGTTGGAATHVHALAASAVTTVTIASAGAHAHYQKGGDVSASSGSWQVAEDGWSTSTNGAHEHPATATNSGNVEASPNEPPSMELIKLIRIR